MAGHVTLVPGYGFVTFTDGEVALLPGLGFVVNDGSASVVNATVNVTAWNGLTVSLGSPTVSADSSVTVSAWSGLTVSLGNPTVSTSSSTNVIKGVTAYVGPRANFDFTSARTTTAGISGEPNATVIKAGAKAVTASILAKTGIKPRTTGTRSQTKGVTAYVGPSVSRFAYSVNKTSGQKSVVGNIQIRTGSRLQSTGVDGKVGSVVASKSVAVIVGGTVTKAGTGGGITQNDISNIVTNVLTALGTNPPLGLTEAISLSTMDKYRNDQIERGLKRYEFERLLIAAAAGNSFGFQSPPGVWMPTPGTQAGYYAWGDNTKQRIKIVHDGTANRIIQTYDTSD